MGLPMEKVFVNLDRYGNTSAASIPLALDEAVKAGRVRRGDLVVLVGFGAGLTWGANVIRWSKMTSCPKSLICFRGRAPSPSAWAPICAPTPTPPGPSSTRPTSTWARS